MKNKISSIFKLTNKKTITILYAIAVITIIVMSLASVIYYSTKKQGYHVDEIYSFGLSNSSYKPFLDSHDRHDSSPEKVSPNYYKDYLTVNSDNRFDYKSVVYNQEHDVHPPLYYMILHTVCSFFPGELNKWFGIAINIVFFILTVLFLWLTARLLTKNKVLHLVCIALYGLSTGAICSVIYIRMYMLLTMFATIYSYIHTKMIVGKNVYTRDLVLLSITVFLGFYTQYYFIIFAFLVSLAYFLFICLSRQWSKVRDYVIAIAIPMIAMLIIYPYAYTTILGVNNSVDGFNHAQYAINSSNRLLLAIREFAHFLNMELFSNLLIPVIILMSIAILFGVIKKFYKIKISANGLDISRTNVHIPKRLHAKPQLIAGIILAFATLLYFLIVSKITYYKLDRYIFPIYPIVSILFVLTLYYTLKFIVFSQKLKYIPIGIVVASVSIIISLQHLKYSPSGALPDTLYPDDKIVNDYISNHKDNTVCLYAYTDGNEWAEMIYSPWLQKCSEIYKSNINDAREYISEKLNASANSYTLFIEDDSNDETSEQIKSLLDATTDKTGIKDINHVTDVNAWNHWSVPATMHLYSLER